jgi:hypothetical protein
VVGHEDRVERTLAEVGALYRELLARKGRELAAC